MGITATDEETTAAEAYEELHVPALFRQWAPRVIEAAQIQSGDRVLDVACGTGVLAREATRNSGAEGYVAAVDISPGMLAVASRRTPEIEWRLSPAESLPFDDDSFDAVISQFGLMFFEDRSAAIREMMRVLAPGGRVAAAVWASLEDSEAYAIEVALLERLAGRQAANALRAPFVLGDVEHLGGLFEDSGVASAAVTTHHGRARFPDIRTMVEADLRGWLPVMGVVLCEEEIERILKEAEHDLRTFVTANGTVEFDSPAHIVTGYKPQRRQHD